MDRNIVTIRQVNPPAKVAGGKASCPTIFGYFGGKFRMSQELIKWIPKHENYIELFAGGLSMFFRKPKAKWNLVNDLNKDIVNLYYVVGHPYLYEQFKEQCFYLINSRTIYELTNQTVNGSFEFPNARRAAFYLYHISTSFNKIVHTGFAINAGNWNTTLLDALELSRKKLNDTVVENKDYVDIVKKFQDKKDTFWYADPPYVVADDKEYYKYNFKGNEDHVKFRDNMELVHKAGGKIMISYDDLPLIRDLFDASHWRIHDFVTKYSSNGINTNELVILNYDKPNEQLGLL